MKKLLIGLYMIMFSLTFLVQTGFGASDDQPFVLIPKAQNENYVDAVEKLSDPSVGNFRGMYEYFGDAWTKKTKPDLGSQLASGIVTRDTILLMLVQVVKFIANMALVVGAAMIIYAGYLYVMSVYAGDNTSKANEAIKDAAIGVVIVVFSYAIQRIVTQAFLS